jgi:NTE family protein
MGVLKYLAEKNKLEEISYISSVSGGSLLIGLIYSLNNNRWPSSKEYLEIILPKLRKKFTEKSLIKDVFKNLLKINNLKYIFHRVDLISYTLENNWGN